MQGNLPLLMLKVNGDSTRPPSTLVITVLGRSDTHLLLAPRPRFNIIRSELPPPSRNTSTRTALPLAAAEGTARGEPLDRASSSQLGDARPACLRTPPATTAPAPGLPHRGPRRGPVYRAGHGPCARAEHSALV